MRNLLASIRAALRSAMGSLKGAFAWLHDGWEWMASTPLGRGCGYAWTAAKLPVAAVAEVPGKLVRSTVALVDGIVAAPGHIVGGLARALGGGAQTSEAEAAAKAAARARQEQDDADAASDARAQIQAVRRVAAARARGQAPEADAVDRLPTQIVRYLLALDRGECEMVARARTGALRLLLEAGKAPEGVRSPKEVAEDLRRAARPSPESPEARKGRFRQAIKDQRAARSSELVSRWEARATAG